MGSIPPWRVASGQHRQHSPALGWKATIKGLVNKGLAKADEVEWSGVNEWLDMQGGKVAKTQVLDFLRGNGVQVQEVVNSDDPAILKNWPGDKTLPANTKYSNTPSQVAPTTARCC